MKYRLQRVDLHNFIESELPLDQLPRALREALREALRNGTGLTALAQRAVKELLNQGSLRPLGSLRSGGERIVLYALPGSARVYDLRRLLAGEAPTPDDSSPSRPPTESGSAPSPASAALGETLSTPSLVPPRTVESGNGAPWPTLRAIRATLQRDWVSYGLDASLESLLVELRISLADPTLRLMFWEKTMGPELNESDSWELVGDGHPLGLALMRAVSGSLPMGGVVFDGRRWLPMWVQDQQVGVLGGAPQIPTAQLEEAAGAVRDLLAAARRSQRRVFNDALTGVHNRGYFDRQFAVEMERSRRSATPLTLLFADMDHFKQVNDEHGHEAGDLVLRSVASLLVSHLRRIDYVFRYGGEEFAMLLPGTDRGEALRTAERLRQTVANTPVVLPSGQRLRITLSIGGAVHPDHGDMERVVLRCADMAMYQAKERGRDRVVMWTPTNAA